MAAPVNCNFLIRLLYSKIDHFISERCPLTLLSFGEPQSTLVVQRTKGCLGSAILTLVQRKSTEKHLGIIAS